MLFETKGMTTEPRREGMAVIEIDPASPDFGEVLVEYPLPAGTVGHHIFYSPDRTHAYVTSLGSEVLHVFDMTAQPYRRREIAVPGCILGEDVAFSPATGRWFLTCMGSSRVVVGDLATDEVIGTWVLPEPWPHGITVREDLGRVLVTSTANPANPGEYGDSVTELDLTAGEVIAVHSTRNSGAEAPSGPVEIFFVPHAEPPVAYVTNIPQGDLWIAVAGYMRDFGRLVVGAELDWDRVGIDLQDPEEDDPSGSVGSIARAKLRLGFDAGRFLPYVTAGVARISFDGFNEEFLDPESRGRVLGLGATFAVSDRFTVGLEALRHDFDDTPDRVGDPSQFDTEIDTVSLRGSFRF